MRLAVISTVEMVIAEHISTIDKICHHLWEFPISVRYYNVVLETNANKDVTCWAELYFGCRFLSDSTEKLPRVKSTGSFASLSTLVAPKPPRSSSSTSSSPRSNSPSPRFVSSPSPRMTVSPRKLSSVTVTNLQLIGANCNHAIILGAPENLGLLLKLLGDMTVIVLSNL